MDARRSSLVVAIALTMVAATIHIWVMREHFEEWWFYGVLFLLAALLQGFCGVALWLWGGRRIFLLGIGGNLAIVVFYLITRTVGVPFGPHAGDVEVGGCPGSRRDLSEVALVVTLALLLRQGRPGCRSGGGVAGRGWGERPPLPAGFPSGNGCGGGSWCLWCRGRAHRAGSRAGSTSPGRPRPCRRARFTAATGLSGMWISRDSIPQVFEGLLLGRGA